jgi:hypothetical protein
VAYITQLLAISEGDSMQRTLRTVAAVGVFISFVLGLGFWIYSSASSRAAQGESPLAESAMLVLLIIWWWSPDSVLFSRAAPFDKAGITEAPLKPEVGRETESRGTLMKRMVWTIGSLISWILLASQADTAARLAFLDPTQQHLISYVVRSLVFILFLFLWITAFPIFGAPEAKDHSTTPRPRHTKYLWRVTAVIVGLSIGAVGLWRTQLLLQDREISGTQKFNAIQAPSILILLVLYIALVTRRFLWPGLYSLFVSSFGKSRKLQAG